ncbi:hypothetical protein TNCV_1440181 [Trichonephila clavipes]|nr:hypothetical protein TNCV_1440181 [Trichonephila clavipes]
MIVCPKKFPHTVTPCEIAVCRSTINAGSDRWPVRLQTRVRWFSTETESGFITEDDTSPVCHTPSCPRSEEISTQKSLTVITTLIRLGIGSNRDWVEFIGTYDHAASVPQLMNRSDWSMVMRQSLINHGSDVFY